MRNKKEKQKENEKEKVSRNEVGKREGRRIRDKGRRVRKGEGY